MGSGCPPPLLRAASDEVSVDDFWDAWSRGAEIGLFQAFCRAGGPAAPGMQAFLCRGRSRIRGRRLGCRWSQCWQAIYGQSW